MDPAEILARAHEAASRSRRSFDPDGATIPGRMRTALACEAEHDHAQEEFIEQGKRLVAKTVGQGVPFERVRDAQALFLKAMGLRRAQYRRATRAWASGASGHLPVPIPDLDPVIDLAEALLSEDLD